MRDPCKGARWVKDRYFHVIGRSNWNFATKGSADGKTVVLKLFLAPAVAIIRHFKIAEAAHPFDPAWAEYLAHRRAVQTEDDGWAVVTRDGQLSAQFEHTVALTGNGVRVLTLRPGERKPY